MPRVPHPWTRGRENAGGAEVLLRRQRIKGQSAANERQPFLEAPLGRQEQPFAHVQGAVVGRMLETFQQPFLAGREVGGRRNLREDKIGGRRLSATAAALSSPRSRLQRAKRPRRQAAGPAPPATWPTHRRSEQPTGSATCEKGPIETPSVRSLGHRAPRRPPRSRLSARRAKYAFARLNDGGADDKIGEFGGCALRQRTVGAAIALEIPLPQHRLRPRIIDVDAHSGNPARFARRRRRPPGARPLTSSRRRPRSAVR